MNEQFTDKFDEINPWKDIWLHPRKTIEWIVENHSNLFIPLILIYLAGIHYGIVQAEIKDKADSLAVINIVTISIFISGLGGLIMYNAWIWGIDFSATWLFDGKGNFKKTQMAFAWSMLPMLAGLILSLIGYLLFDDEIFKSETPNIDSSDFLTISYWIYGIIEMALAIWHFVLFIVTLSQVQKISIIKSIASYVIGFLILLLPFMMIFLSMKF